MENKRVKYVQCDDYVTHALLLCNDFYEWHNFTKSNLRKTQVTMFFVLVL